MKKIENERKLTDCKEDIEIQNERKKRERLNDTENQRKKEGKEIKVDKNTTTNERNEN